MKNTLLKVKKICTGVILKAVFSFSIVMLLVTATGVETVQASLTYLQYNCSGNCPQSTTIWVTSSLDKASYAPGENVILNVYMTSDDNPQPISGSNICPIARGNINGGTFSADMFPSCYSATQIRDTISSSISLGQAPATSGTAAVSLSSNGYSPVSINLPITVTAPSATPCVRIAFGTPPTPCQ